MAKLGRMYRLGPVVGAVSLATTLALAGCGGDSGGDSGIHAMGLGMPSPALVGVNLIFAEASLNGHPGGRLLIDTGSPFTLINPAQFPGATLAPTTQVTVNLGFGGVTVDNVPALQLTGSTMDDLHLAGIGGGNMMKQFSAAFDYRGMKFRLGDGPAPDGAAQPGTEIPFVLQGGGAVMAGAGMTVLFSATRIPVTVDIEGTSHQFILDTGASEVNVRSSLFTQLTADGRPQLGGFPVTTASGPATATVTRTRSVSVAGETVTNVATMTIGDTLLDSLSGEVGHTVDGLLGGTYLREFFVNVDYARGKLHLQRYASRDHIVDELQRVGIATGAGTAGGGISVVTVYARTDAEQKGIGAGDELLTVDGVPVDPLDAIANEIAVQGAVGTTKVLGFGTAQSPNVAHMQLTVRVDDLVPPPVN
jgi:hypothetical protein